MGCFGFLIIKKKNQGSDIWFHWFDKHQDRDSASRTRCSVFKSNQFSFVPNRKGNIFHRGVLRSPDSSSDGCSCIERSATEGEGICFEFMLWIFDVFLQSLHTCGGAYRILFKLLRKSGRWFEFLGPLRSNGSRKKKPNESDGEIVDVRNNFSFARSGTSFQWWARRGRLWENLKYANSV